MVKRNGGKSEVVCSQAVQFSPDDYEEKVLGGAAAAVNADGRCREAGIRAAVIGSRSPGQREDKGPTPFRLVLDAPRLVGVQLITQVAVSGPGAFTVDNYGAPLRHALVVPQLALSGTARGGELQVTERSRLGTCSLTVRTKEGEEAEAVATRVRQAFFERRKEAEFDLAPACPEAQNPQDVSRYGATLRFPLGQELTVVNTDLGLGFRIGSDR
jgi:hypothetical protein